MVNALQNRRRVKRKERYKCATLSDGLGGQQQQQPALVCADLMANCPITTQAASHWLAQLRV